MGRIVAWDELSLFGVWDELSLGTNRRLGRIVALRQKMQSCLDLTSRVPPFSQHTVILDSNNEFRYSRFDFFCILHHIPGIFSVISCLIPVSLPVI